MRSDKVTQSSRNPRNCNKPEERSVFANLRRILVAAAFMLTGMTVLGLAIVVSLRSAVAQLSDEEYVRQALAAGPEPIAKDAAVVRPEPDGSMRTIRQGTNGFTCLIMGTDRMCADKNSIAFIHAVMRHQPPADQLGFAYMLGGDTGPAGEVGGTCNSSPFATAKDSDCHWIVTGPHVMLFGPPSKALGYARSADPDPTKPYMVWANTPYEHAMVPVK
jgi:hypothetical protein